MVASETTEHRSSATASPPRSDGDRFSYRPSPPAQRPAATTGMSGESETQAPVTSASAVYENFASAMMDESIEGINEPATSQSQMNYVENNQIHLHRLTSLPLQQPQHAEDEEQQQRRNRYASTASPTSSLATSMVLRVFQLDGLHLEEEISGKILLQHLLSVFDYNKPLSSASLSTTAAEGANNRGTAHPLDSADSLLRFAYIDEAVLLFRLLIYKLSVWNTCQTFGDKFQNILYRCEYKARVHGLDTTSTSSTATVPSDRKLILHCVLTLIVPYCFKRFSRYVLLYMNHTSDTDTQHHASAGTDVFDFPTAASIMHGGSLLQAIRIVKDCTYRLLRQHVNNTWRSHAITPSAHRLGRPRSSFLSSLLSTARRWLHRLRELMPLLATLTKRFYLPLAIRLMESMTQVAVLLNFICFMAPKTFSSFVPCWPPVYLRSSRSSCIYSGIEKLNRWIAQDSSAPLLVNSRHLSAAQFISLPQQSNVYVTGKYRSLADRLLQLRLVYGRQKMHRVVELNWMNQAHYYRVILEFFATVLPIIAPSLGHMMGRLWRSIIGRVQGEQQGGAVNGHRLGGEDGRGGEASQESEERGETNGQKKLCSHCRVAITMPYRADPCGHYFSYSCLAAGLEMRLKKKRKMVAASSGPEWILEPQSCFHCPVCSVLITGILDS